MLCKRVTSLSRQLHAALKEWALHIDPTITEAYVRGNVMKDDYLHINRNTNVFPPWATIKNLEILSTSPLNTGH